MHAASIGRFDHLTRRVWTGPWYRKAGLAIASALGAIGLAYGTGYLLGLGLARLLS